MRIADVQRFCLRDGPGIRTTVFLQGCGLHCWWCHNPQMQAASSKEAREVDTNALADELMRDERYWLRSGGGVTLSGGEPLCQAGACAELFTELGTRGVHRCVETAGAVQWDAFEVLVSLVDLWYFDMKSAAADTFREGTGGDLEQVRENLRELIGRVPDRVTIRLPLIHGFNADAKALEALGRQIVELAPGSGVQILPGHDLHVDSARKAAVSREECEDARRILATDVSDVEVCW
jgi:pyruvate formate lyase activating enzyme